ncbi:MAG: hypothetical protein ACETVQ_01680 [Candidatus Bathyarchaeia archaeon]
MRFKIKNELEDTDYKRLTDFLKDNPGISIELFPGADLEFAFVSPVTVAIEGFGYKIDTEILFEQPIGFEVYEDLKLDDEMHGYIAVNRRNLKLSMIVAEPTDLENDLNMILKTLERIVNQMSIRFDKLVEQAFTLNSEWLDRQLNMILEREELEKRGEIPRPFGTMHAKSSRDAKERAGGLVPLYKERDKTYLYDAKRVYFLLPHDFVANLLRCDDTTMIREEEFDKRGKEVLRDLVYKKRLRKHETMDGIVCYYSLDGKTRRYLIKHLERKTSRL